MTSRPKYNQYLTSNRRQVPAGIVDKEEMKKKGTDGQNKNQLSAFCLMVVNFALSPVLYFLVVPKASLKDGVFN